MVTRLSAEMLVDLPIVQDARMSPDGKHVTVAVGPMSKKDEHPVSAIWIVAADGSEPERQLTSGLTNDSSARWSPHSDEIAFLSDRVERGTQQVFLLRLSGGEARKLTDERGGVSDLCWLPGGGRRVAYLAVDARDEETQRKRDEERDDANVYGEFWPFARLAVHDLDSGDTRRYDLGDRHVAGIAPSPEGSRLALMLWPTPEIDHIMGGSRLVILHLASGRVDEIGRLPAHPDSVTWSATGDSVYYVAGAGPTAVSSSQIWNISLQADAQPVCLTADQDACVINIAHGASTTSLLALIAAGTDSMIASLCTDTGTVHTIASFEGDLASLTSDRGGQVAMLGRSASRHWEVHVASSGGAPQRITSFHGWMDDVALGHQEVVRWERAGFELDGILIWPAGKSRDDGPVPTIVSIHGGPYGRWPNSFTHGAFGNWLAEQGFLVFLPNPRGGMGHGQKFAEAVLNTVGQEDYLDIMAGLDMLVEANVADPDRLGCGGWSQGGFMTAWIVGHTDRFKAAVMGAGISDWGMMIATSDIPSYENLMGGGNPYESAGPHSFDCQSPISYVHNATTPTLIVHGENDARVPVSQSIFFHRGMRAYGVPAELVTYPREPHGLQERNHQLDLLRRVAAWYSKWIPLERV